MLIPRLTNLQQKLARLPGNFGDPRYSTIALDQGNTQVLLTPKLKVLRASEAYSNRNTYQPGSWLSSAIQLDGEELIILGISRNYPLAILQDATYLVDATLSGTVYTGKAYELLQLNTRNTLTVDALVKPYREK